MAICASRQGRHGMNASGKTDCPESGLWVSCRNERLTMGNSPRRDEVNQKPNGTSRGNSEWGCGIMEADRRVHYIY